MLLRQASCRVAQHSGLVCRVVILGLACQVLVLSRIVVLYRALVVVERVGLYH